MTDTAAIPGTKPGICQGCPLINNRAMPSLIGSEIDILVVGGTPLLSDVTRGAFSSPQSNMVRMMLRAIQKELPVNLQPTVAYTYAVKCAAGDKKVTANIVTQCATLLRMEIIRLRPKVIVLLGADALRAMGYTGSLTSYRGNVYAQKIEGRDVTILPTYHPVQMRKLPGLVPTFKKDLRKSINYWMGTVREIVFDLHYPTKAADIFAALDKMEAEINAKYAAGGRQVAVAVDTETTSLKPWLPEARMIAMSFCWDADGNKGLAIPLDHRKAKLSLKDRETICNRVNQILGDPEKVAVVMHNGKFDEKFINHAYRLTIAPMAWDTLLGEHLIDEDKKGVYGLKQLTADWFPGAGKYEVELHQHLEAIGIARKKQFGQKLAAYTAKLKTGILPYWEGLGLDGRIKAVGDLSQRGVIKEFDNKIIDLDYRCLTEKQKKAGATPKLYKRSENKICSFIMSLPDNEVPADIIRGAAYLKPSEDLLAKPTFEDIPIDIMLKYAAIDAVMTLKILRKQLDTIQAEEAEVRDLQRTKLHGTLTNKRHLTWGYYNISIPLTRLLTEMEYKGIRLDRDRIKQYKTYLEDKVQESTEKLFDQVGYKFNPQSGPALAHILFEELKLPILKRSKKTDDPSTDAAVLKDLYDEHKIPVLKELLYYRKLEKCKSTYLDNWLKRSARDGMLHASFNVNGTATFRLSSSSPWM